MEENMNSRNERSKTNRTKVSGLKIRTNLKAGVLGCRKAGGDQQNF
jgi:hypothetical protein